MESPELHGGDAPDAAPGLFTRPLTRRRFVTSAAVLGGAAATAQWLVPGLGRLAGAIDTTGATPPAGTGVTNGQVTRIFARMLDSGIWYKNNDGAAWGPWIPIGGGSLSSPSVFAAVDGGGDGDSEVFIRSGTGNDAYRAQVPATASWKNLGGLCTSSLAAVVDDAGITHVFFRGNDGGLWTRRLPDGSTTWGAQQPLGGLIVGPPTAAKYDNNNVLVFARGGDRAIWYKVWNGTAWGGWQNLGGILNFAPAAATDDDGRIVVAAVGSDRALWHQRLSGGGTAPNNFTGWQSLGGLCTSDTAAANDDGGVSLFVRGGPNNDLGFRRLPAGSNTFSPLVSLGGPLAWGAAVVGTPTGVVVLAQRGSDLVFTGRTDASVNYFPFARWSSWPFGFAHPGLIADESGGLGVFMRADDLSVWYGRLTLSETGPWEDRDHPPSIDVRSDVVGVGGAANVTDMYMVGSDRKLWSQTYNGTTWGSWVDRAGSGLISSSPATVRRDVDEVYTFVRSNHPTNNQIWANVGGTATWLQMLATGSPSSWTSEPAVVVDGDGLMHVFVRGSTNAMYHATWDGSVLGPLQADSSSWTNLGGGWTSDPVAVKSGNQIHVLARGLDNAIWRNRWNGSSWLGFASIGGVCTSGPGVTRGGDLAYDVLVRGVENALWRRHWDGTGLGGWQKLGGNLAPIHGG